MPNQAPAHWSKDFVEHLRTVHFTLIALCVGLIVLASFPSKSEIQLAHEQVSEILAVTNAWNPNVFEVQANKLRKTLIQTDYKELILNPDDTISANFRLVRIPSSSSDLNSSLQPKFKLTDWILSLDIPKELQSNESGYTISPLAVRAPANLKSFEQLWDELLKKGQIFLPKITKKCIAFNSHDGGEAFLTGCEVRSIDTSIATLQPMMVLQRSVVNGVPNLTHQWVLSQIRDKDWEYEFSYFSPVWILPIRSYKQVEFDGHRVLTQQSPRWGQKYRRTFKDAFRELAAVDGPLEDADIPLAERILDAEAKRTEDAFEAAGLKIPADIAVRCGVLLVLGVQLYMLIHLREFGNRFDREKGFEVAWIGVYASRLARAMLIISLLVLPACTVVLLSMRGLTMTNHKRIAWAALVASNVGTIVLSYLVYHALPERIDQSSNAPEPPKPPSCPAQMFE